MGNGLRSAKKQRALLNRVVRGRAKGQRQQHFDALGEAISGLLAAGVSKQRIQAEVADVLWEETFGH